MFVRVCACVRACVCVCGSECVQVCIHVCSLVIKIRKKFTYMDSNISSWMAQIPFFYSLTLTFILMVKFLEFFSCFANISQTVRDRANQACHAFEWCHCECCTSWPWTTFSRPQNVNILKTVSASQKCSRTTYRGWYLPSNETIVNTVLHDLDLNFQCQTFQVAILTKAENCKSYYCHQIGSQIFAIEWCHCECCTS